MSRQATPAPFRVFVYGTLKRGFSNHEYFCRGVTAIEDAVICGRLYALNAHIPALAIPDTSVLAHGSLDNADDHRCQRSIVIDREQPVITDAWRMIHGEVLTFSEPERLARLDHLEGVRQGCVSTTACWRLCGYRATNGSQRGSTLSVIVRLPGCCPLMKIVGDNFSGFDQNTRS